MFKGPKGEKRPADVISNAVKVMRIATGEDTDAAGGGDSGSRLCFEANRPLASHITKKAKSGAPPLSDVPSSAPRFLISARVNRESSMSLPMFRHAPAVVIALFMFTAALAFADAFKAYQKALSA